MNLPGGILLTIVQADAPAIPVATRQSTFFNEPPYNRVGVCNSPFGFTNIASTIDPPGHDHHSMRKRNQPIGDAAMDGKVNVRLMKRHF